MRPEVENSLEVGYRFQSGQRWSADFATFWSYYTSLTAVAMPQNLQVEMVDGMPEFLVNLVAVNSATARSYGGEASATWQITPAWRLVLPTLIWMKPRACHPASNGCWSPPVTVIRERSEAGTTSRATCNWI